MEDADRGAACEKLPELPTAHVEDIFVFDQRYLEPSIHIA